jgi:endo-1,4-beta-D-glucanase Y
VRITSLPLSAWVLICGSFAVGCGNSGAAGGNTTEPATGGGSSAGGNGGSGGVGNSGGASSGVDTSGTGGTSVSTGTQPVGGTSSISETTTSGGETGAGGTTATGGKAAGGSTSTNGTVATGGKAAGGSTSTSGTVATGGKAAGGSTSTSGTVATGGKAAGGSTSTGGATGLGGKTSSGGTAAVGGATGGSTSTAIIEGCTPPATYTNLFVTLSGHTQADSDTKVAAAWTKLFNPSGSPFYHNGPGSDESYVEDAYHGDVRSEGMSYGMMTAVQLDHQTEFDRMWTWVRNHMAQGCSGDKCTGEIAWQCSTSGSKMSTGGAPDGEEYFATALIFAHNRWGDTSGKYKYGTEAQWVLDLLRTKYFNTTYHIVKFVSGSSNTDGSYILPAFYQTWACFDTANADFWNSAVTAGRTWFHSAINSNGVIPDQSGFTNGSSGSAGSDTIRCVMNIMMDYNFFKADPWQTATYAPMYGANQKTAGPNAQGFCDATLGFGLPAADGKPFVDRIWSAAIPTSYWDGTLYMLALLHVSGNFKLYY